MRVVLAGGGTAGHIEPALNTADALRERIPDVGISVLGTERGLETRLVPARGYELTLIPAVPLPRRPDIALVSLPARLAGAIGEVRAHLRQVNADVLVGFGGYVALPAYFAAKAEGVPIIVHEANARAGLANRVGSRFAALVLETVRGSLPKARAVGLPLRTSIAKLDRAGLRPQALANWSLAADRPTVLAFGGSQGARRLNQVVADAAPRLVDSGYQILHSVGQANADHLRSDRAGYVTVPYIDRMDLAYAAADVAVSRAGAMTVAELTAVGLPAIYVPLPIGNGEQRLNALPVVEAGGGVVVSDAAVSSDFVVQKLGEWLAGDLPRLSAAARSCGRPDAAAAVIDGIMEVVRAVR